MHESKHLDERDFTILDAIPVTRPARTILDLAAVVDERVLRLALADALRRGLVGLDQLRHRWHQLGGTIRPGGYLMEHVLDTWRPVQALATTPGESDLLLHLLDAGLPEPVPQFWLELPNGEWARLDFAWLQWRVGLEFDPFRWHGGELEYDRLFERKLLARQAGWELIHVTGSELDAGLPTALPALREALIERGASLTRAEHD